MKHYTSAQMLALWRSRLGFDAVRTDCTVEAVDGHDVDSLIAQAMRSWYLRQLDEAPASLVNMARALPVSATSLGAGVMQVRLPDTCRRVTAVTAARWNLPARLVDADAPDAVALMSRIGSPYGMPDNYCPVAVIAPDRLYLLPLDEGDAFMIDGVIDPGDESYIIDESLLSTIPETL